MLAVATCQRWRSEHQGEHMYVFYFENINRIALKNYPQNNRLNTIRLRELKFVQNDHFVHMGK